ncbi:MAG TPA: transposase [Armatimonadota bacterium]|nr:transposase [Armatimonadota bacterium]
MIERAVECPKRKQLRLPGHDYGEPGHAYSLTVCARRGASPFRHRTLAQEAVATLQSLEALSGVKVFAYCVMPDHVHLVCWAGDGADSIPSFIRRFKSFVSHAGRRLGHSGQLWQRSYYDHVIRRAEDLGEICTYVIENPVRRGMVQEVGEYPFAGMPNPDADRSGMDPAPTGWSEVGADLLIGPEGKGRAGMEPGPYGDDT